MTARSASLKIVLRSLFIRSGALISAVGAGDGVGAGVGTTLGTLAVGAVLGETVVGTLGTAAVTGETVGAELSDEVGTLGTLAVFWSKISLSCSRILRLSEFGGGNRSFEMVDLSVTLKSWRTALRRSSLDEIGIFKSPCGNHRTVSAMRTLPVEGTSTR